MSRFQGESVELQSADSVFREGGACLYPDEFLHILDISGVVPHLLRLKIGLPVTILRELNPDRDMCQGKKTIVRRISQGCVEIDLFNGNLSWSREFIPGTPLHSADKEISFTLVRPPVPDPAAFCDLYE